MNNAVPFLIGVVLSTWNKCLPPPFGTAEYLQIKPDETHCNNFVQEVISKFGYTKLAGLMANEMAKNLIGNPDWLKISGDIAQNHANAGALVVAAWYNPDGHGHVCVVIPGKCTASQKWGITSDQPRVPIVANVGAIFYSKIGIGANFAFGSDEPDYYVLKSSIIDQ